MMDGGPLAARTSVGHGLRHGAASDDLAAPAAAAVFICARAQQDSCAVHIRPWSSWPLSARPAPKAPVSLGSRTRRWRTFMVVREQGQ